jgi:hypothetical protein
MSQIRRTLRSHFVLLVPDAACFRERDMPITRLAKEGAFAPEEIALLTKTFEDACRVLGLTDPNDRSRDLVAKRIIEAAQAGERDPERLRASGVRAGS